MAFHNFLSLVVVNNASFFIIPLFCCSFAKAYQINYYYFLLLHLPSASRTTVMSLLVSLMRIGRVRWIQLWFPIINLISILFPSFVELPKLFQFWHPCPCYMSWSRGQNTESHLLAVRVLFTTVTKSTFSSLYGMYSILVWLMWNPICLAVFFKLYSKVVMLALV